MLSMIFMIMMLSILAGAFRFALRLSWGFGKLMFSFIFLPVIITFALVMGFLRFAMPVVLVVLLASLISSSKRAE